MAKNVCSQSKVIWTHREIVVLCTFVSKAVGMKSEYKHRVKYHFTYLCCRLRITQLSTKHSCYCLLTELIRLSIQSTATFACMVTDQLSIAQVGKSVLPCYKAVQ